MQVQHVSLQLTIVIHDFLYYMTLIFEQYSNYKQQDYEHWM